MSRRFFSLVSGLVVLPACAAGAVNVPPAEPVTAAPVAPAAPSASAFVPAPGDPLRSHAPITAAEAEPPAETPQLIELPNGMRVALLERHGFPLVSARLWIALPTSSGDTHADARAHLAAEVFLAPGAGAEQPSFGCASYGCGVQMQGAPSELGDILAREAALARTEPAAAEEARRYAVALVGYPAYSGALKTNAFYTERVALFGWDHPFTAFVSGVHPLSLDELRRWRAETFVPSAVTLAIVGDTTVAQVRAEAARRFGSWSGPAAAPHEPPALPPLPAARVLFTPNGYNPLEYVEVVARGPSWGDPDVAPLLVAAEMDLAALPSPVPCQDQSAVASDARAGIPLAFFPGASIVQLGGAFEHGKGVAAMEALLSRLRTARVEDVPDGAVAQAKLRVLAAWRGSLAQRRNAAGWLSFAIDAGSPDSLGDLSARISAVSAADVRRVSAKYFADDALRLVLVGTPKNLERFGELGFGRTGTVVDERGAPPKKTAPK